MSYVDVVILGNDTDLSPYVNKLIQRAKAICVPVISEDFKRVGAEKNGKDTNAS
jgi:hypothetical protein